MIALIDKVLGCCSQEVGKIIIAIVFKIAIHTLIIGICFSRLCEIYRRRIREKQEMVNTILLGLFLKPLLPVATCPVVRAVFLQIALRTACLIVDITICSLRCRTGTEVYSPARQANTFGITIIIHLLTEEPSCCILLLSSSKIITYIFGCPTIAGTEILYGLYGMVSIDANSGRR